MYIHIGYIALETNNVRHVIYGYINHFIQLDISQLKVGLYDTPR